MLEYGTSPHFWFNVWEAVKIISCGCPDFRHIGTFAYFEFWRSGCVTSNAFLKTNLAFFSLRLGVCSVICLCALL